MQLTAAEIQALIPNRYPICYMDGVSALTPDQSITAYKNLTINDRFLPSYQPETLVMPNSLIVEALAQAASILILKSPQFAGKTAYLGGIHRAAFPGHVFPGDRLDLQIELGRQRGNMGLVHCTAQVATETIATAELTFIVNPINKNDGK